MSYLAFKTAVAAIAQPASFPIQQQTSFSAGLGRFSEVPLYEKLGSQVAMVVGWIRAAHEQRLSIGRSSPGGGPASGAWKTNTYQVPLYLHGVAKSAQDGGEDWDHALWLVATQFRTTAIPVLITDPKTQLTYSLREIGERIDLFQAEPEPIPRGNGTTGLIHFFAEMSVTGIVDFQS